ncbi:MAG: RIO1 family regulatory kinase/ATPase [Nanoarchaeota archaeon]
MVNKINNLLEELNEKDIAVLRIIEGLRTAFQFAPVSKIKERYNYKDKREVEKILNKLNKLELVEHGFMKNEDAYRLRNLAYEVLAFWDLKKQGIIKELLRVIGIGKEAKVYLAKSFTNEPLIAKVHLYSGQKFEDIKRSLSYLAIKWRAEQLNIFDFQLDIPRAKAQIEAIVLDKLKNYNVPRFITINRHVVVTEMIGDKEKFEPAPQLHKIKLADKESAKALKEDILEHYNEIYEKGEIVHGDLSEKNILFDLNQGKFYFIDWPQAVPRDFERAEELYQRDIENIKNYFKRKYKV